MESILSVYNDPNGSYIMLMRGDSVDDGDVDLVASGKFNGKLVIDLDGHTVTNKKANYLMNFTYSATVVNSPSVTFKDGTLIKDGNSFGLIKFDYSATLTANVYCSITFENITFRSLVNYNKNTSVVFVTYEGGYGTATGTVNVNATFNDCTYDFVGSIDKAVMIPMRHYYYTEKEQVIFNTTVNGGTAIAASASEFTSYFYLANGNTNGRADKVTFGMYDGKYITLEGINVPTDEFDTAEGYKAVFGNVDGTCTLVPNEFKMFGAYLNITENINVCYAVGLPAGYTNPYMVFEFNGDTYTVTEYTIDATGKYVFKFMGVTPQLIGKNIKATLYATYNGETVTLEKATYSVKEYCTNMLADTADTKLITLLSDLLTYGAASQTYTGVTDALVTDGVEGLTPSEFAAVTASKKGITGEESDLYKWNAVALRYENTMAMKFSFTATDVTNLTVKVTINDRETVFTASDFYTENGKYVVYFRGILATEYDEVVTACFYADGVQVGQTVTYSVNSYVYTMQNSTSESLAALVKATYNYGASAVAYNK